jgi:ribosomal-protein-alanine N-acetyltransferase
MKSRPTIQTSRLVLRPFTDDDIPSVQELASHRAIAENTASIPHPYPEGAAAQWIATHDEDFEQDRIHHFAIALDGRAVGSIGLILKGDGIAEIGYWLGVPYWNRGYVTEAAEALLRYGFEECGLHRIYAAHFTRNAGSGRVLQKIGMTYEGTLRHHIRKWDEYLDVAFYGVLRDEWLGRQ